MRVVLTYTPHAHPTDEEDTPYTMSYTSAAAFGKYLYVFGTGWPAIQAGATNLWVVDLETHTMILQRRILVKKSSALVCSEFKIGPSVVGKGVRTKAAKQAVRKKVLHTSKEALASQVL